MATGDPSNSGGRRTVPDTSGGGYPSEAGLEGEAVSGRSSGGVPRLEEAGAGSCPPGAGEGGLRDDGEDQVTHVGEDNGFQLYEKVDSKETEEVRQLRYSKDQEDEQKCNFEIPTHRNLLQVGADEMGEEGAEQTVIKKAVSRELQPAAVNPLTVIEDCDGRHVHTSEAFEGLLHQVKIKDEEISRLIAQLEKMKSDAARVREHNRKTSQEVLQLKDQLKVARESSNYVSDEDLSYVVGERAFMDGNMEQMKAVNHKLTAKLVALEEENKKLKSEVDSFSSSMKRIGQVSSDLATADSRIQRLKQDIIKLRSKNDELQSQVDLANAQAVTFEEDFRTERKDREKAAVRYEQQREGLSRRVEELRQQLQAANEDLERHKDVTTSLEVVKEKLDISLQKAHEEIQVKSSQVKQYKKQVDSLKEQLEKRGEENTSLVQEFEKVRSGLVKEKEQVRKLKKSKKSSTSKEATPSPVHSPVTAKALPPGTVREETYRKLEKDYDHSLRENNELQRELDSLKEVYAGLQAMYQEDMNRRKTPVAVSPIPEEPPPPPRTGKKQQSPGPPPQPAARLPDRHQQPAFPPTHPQHLGDSLAHAQRPPPSHHSTPSSHPQQSPPTRLPSQSRLEQSRAAYHHSQHPQQQAHEVGYYEQTEERAAGSGAFVNQLQSQAGEGALSVSPHPSGGPISMPAVGQQHLHPPVGATPAHSSAPQRAVPSPADPQLGGISNPVGEPLRAVMPPSNVPSRKQEPNSQPRDDFRSRMSSSPPDVDTLPAPVVHFDSTFGQLSGHAPPQSDQQAHFHQAGQLQPPGSVGQGYSYPQDQYQHRRNMELPLDQGGMNVGRLSSQSPVSPQYQSHGSSVAAPQPKPRRQTPGQSPSHREHTPLYAQRESESQPPSQSSDHYRTQASVPASQSQYAQDASALIQGIDSDISQEAEHVADMLSDGSRQRPTQKHVPYDRNLVCPQCNKMFRVGEIQKFRSHVRECQGPNGTDSSYV